MEVSPYIHPSFKIAMSRSNGLQMKNIVKLCALDVSRSSGVFAMELHYEYWCGNFRGKLLEIVFTAVSLPFNEVLESSLVPTTVEYLLYFPLCFSIDDYEQWVVFHFSSWNQVVQSRSELHYIKYWMELLHPMWQL